MAEGWIACALMIISATILLYRQERLVDKIIHTHENYVKELKEICDKYVLSMQEFYRPTQVRTVQMKPPLPGKPPDVMPEKALRAGDLQGIDAEQEQVMEALKELRAGRIAVETTDGGVVWTDERNLNGSLS